MPLLIDWEIEFNGMPSRAAASIPTMRKARNGFSLAQVIKITSKTIQRVIAANVISAYNSM
jgi:hypothetical protein